MFAISDSYLAGYMAGESDAGMQQVINNCAQTMLGRRPVTVDQKDIDSLYAQLQNAEAIANNNYQIGSEAIARAQKLEQEVAALKSQVATLNRMTGERNGLHKFLITAVHLLQSQRRGKASLPEFAELREYALQIAGIHLDGGIYEGIGDQPEKMAWLRKVWEALR